MSTSAYVPLPHTGDYIRLLRLHPGSSTDDLVGELEIHNLKLKQPEYTATSYVCGNDDRTKYHILVSGLKLGIYENAHEVLRRFRSETESSYLWIDVVCINQDNPAEKGREVNLMWKVYQNSKRTVIWLGPLDHSAKAAIEYARSLDAARFLEEHRATVMYGAYSSRYVIDKSHILDILEHHPQNKTLINSCAIFLLRPYFTRLWTQQEAALSSNPVVVCGQEEVSWNQVFAQAWLMQPRYTMTWPDWFLSDHPQWSYADLEPNLRFISSIQAYRLRQGQVADGAPTTTAYSLLNAMRSASQLRCYDPRDKIYGIRNIATDLALNDWAPLPDYITPWLDVYVDFAVRMAERGDVELLNWSGRCQQEEGCLLPSWVVDWRRQSRIQYINHPEWCAGGKDFRVGVERIPKKRQNNLNKLLRAAQEPLTSLKFALRVTTMMQDTITYLSGVLVDWKAFDDITRLHSDILTLISKARSYIHTMPHPTYITSEPVLDAFNATIIGNTTDQDAIASAEYINSGAQAWRSWLETGANLNDSSKPAYHEAIDSMDVFQHKHFCVSSAGYFCLVPSTTRETDLIVIVKGQDMPMVLRPVGTDYVYLGHSYVHGMMDLQAGTLIEEFRVKFSVEKGRTVVGRPGGDVRRNGRKMDAGEYVRILETLGERKIDII